MPAATDAQVPKPLTYTLMYHFLWCVLFLLSALTLFGVFLASNAGARHGFAGGLLPPIILVALGGLIVSAVVLLFASGSTFFWIFGLALCLWVGPAQASSRSFLARLAKPQQEGQLFGLYATTGRAVSFLAPALFTLCITVATPLVAEGEAQRWGILGIMVVLLAGLLVLLPVKAPSEAEIAVVPQA